MPSAGIFGTFTYLKSSKTLSRKADWVLPLARYDRQSGLRSRGTVSTWLGPKISRGLVDILAPLATNASTADPAGHAQAETQHRAERGILVSPIAS
jgi:hypothetical protein